MASMEERITRLEERHLALMEKVIAHMDHEEEVTRIQNDRLGRLEQDIAAIRDMIGKRAAFATGVAAAVSTIWTVGLAIFYAVFKIKGG